MTTRRRSLCEEIGKGVVSGAIGTAAMTLAQAIEMKATGREGSSAPAQAVVKLLGIEPQDEEARERLTRLVHWAYGTQWGLARALLGAFGLRGPAAALAHFGLVWGTSLVTLPALGIAPPPTEWDPKELAKDAGFHLLYAAAASLVYESVDRS